MPAPLPAEVRESIERAIRDGGKTRNQIARDHSVAGATVSKIARTIETQTGAPPFEQSQTKRARERRADDLAARRVELAHVLAEDVFAIRDRMWAMQTQAVVVPRKGGGASVELVQVPATAVDMKNYMTSIGIAVDKVNVLTKTEDGGEQAATLLGSLVEEIRATRNTGDGAG